MKHLFLRATLCLLALSPVTFLSAQTKTDILTNAGIIKLHKAEIGNDIILSKIESSTCKFDLSENGLISLKNARVSSEIIHAMMDKANGKVSASASTQPAVQEKNKKRES